MIMDKKGKLFGKVSIVDVLIVAIIIIIILFVGAKYTKSATVTPFTQPDKIQLTVYAPNVEDFAVDHIAVGDVVRDWQANVTFGTVKAIEVSDSVVQGIDANGQVVLSSRPDKKTLNIILEGEGIYSENGTTTFGNNSYYVNRSREFAVGDVVFWARIADIKKID